MLIMDLSESDVTPITTGHVNHYKKYCVPL